MTTNRAPEEKTQEHAFEQKARMSERRVLDAARAYLVDEGPCEQARTDDSYCNDELCTYCALARAVDADEPVCDGVHNAPSCGDPDCWVLDADRPDPFHGREAEELRSGVEKLCAEYESAAEGVADLVSDLRRLLDEVDARDSLRHLLRRPADADPTKLTTNQGQR